MRFNPPPNWPHPPRDWMPPPGWEPDPAWGPPPQGWPLWVADDQSSPYGSVSAKAAGSKTGLIVGAVAVVLLLLVGAGIGGYFLLRTSSSSTTATPAAPSESAIASTTAGSPSDCIRSSSVGTKTNPNSLGARAKVGDYCLSVTGVVKDATAEVLAADRSNARPKNGQFMVVTLAATYTGKTQGDTYLDVFLKLQGGDGHEYDDTDCDANVPNALIDADKLPPGQSLSASVCLDVPAAAVQGGVIQLDGYQSGDKVFWQLG